MYKQNLNKYSCCVVLFIALLCICIAQAKCFMQPFCRPPRLTVVIVVDSFSYDYVRKLEPYFCGGLRSLMENGVVYTNARYPHALPVTAVGHTALNTGVYGKDHGIVTNAWFDQQGHKIQSDDDLAADAAVISPTGFYAVGKSPRNITTQGVSDCLMMDTKPCARTKVFSISMKSRAAIATANKMGKAIWFDDQAGVMTSSKFYFSSLPEWLVTFNARHGADKMQSFCWDYMYDKDSAYYQFDTIDQFKDINQPPSILGHTFTIDRTRQEPYQEFEASMYANQLLLDCARECIKANLSCNREERLLIWLCLSPLDKVGHFFGPMSQEAIDMIYHLDDQLKYFFRFIHRHVKQSDVLYVLTADHGVAPVVEYVQHQGYPARRLYTKDIEEEVKKMIRTATGVDVNVYIKTPNVYFSQGFYDVNPRMQDMILYAAKSVLKSKPGIKNVWTNMELDMMCPEPNTVEYWFKQQRYPGRSGSLMIQVEPFSMCSKYDMGTSHDTPYECNIHVPLIIYRGKIFEKKIINSSVSMLQFANSLAQMLQVPGPASSTFPILPGLYPEEQELL